MHEERAIRTSLTRGARLSFFATAWLFTACAVAQIFLAGLGIFERPESLLTHRDFGYLFGWLTLILVLLALVGRLPRRFLVASGGLVALFVVQILLVVGRTPGSWRAALHPLVGLVIALYGAVLGKSAWALVGWSPVRRTTSNERGG